MSCLGVVGGSEGTVPGTNMSICVGTLVSDTGQGELVALYAGKSISRAAESFISFLISRGSKSGKSMLSFLLVALCSDNLGFASSVEGRRPNSNRLSSGIPLSG